jgi:SLT domain-containing protein
LDETGNISDTDFKNTTISKKNADTISSVCSSKYFDPGHKKRIDFLKYLESKGTDLHIYNEDNNHNEIHDYVKQLWNQREIHIIIELLLEYNDKQNEKQILNTILDLTNAKEIKLKEFLKTHFSSL